MKRNKNKKMKNKQKPGTWHYDTMRQGASKDATACIFCWPPTARHKPTFRVICFSIETLSEKRKFSFARGCRLELASAL